MKKNDIERMVLETMITGDFGSVIERQEKQGQQELNRKEMLPRKGCDQELFIKLGFTFGNNIDDLFVEATLPAGWKKRATDHSMWSKLIDDKGRERAAIFYKAAFYDRDAHISLNRRFVTRVQPIGGYGDNYKPGADRECVVADCGNVIWTADQTVKPGNYEAQEKLGQQGIDWLNQHYPDWQSPMAYWD